MSRFTLTDAGPHHQRLGSRDLSTGIVTECGSVTRYDGSYSLTYTGRPGHSDVFPIGRLRRTRGPNEAPRSYRRRQG